MNPVLRAGAETAQLGILMGFTTILFLLAMVGWTWWAYSPSRRRDMELASLLPLDDGAPDTDEPLAGAPDARPIRRSTR